MKHTAYILALLTVGTGSLFFYNISSALAGQISAPAPLGMYFDVPVTSFKEARFTNVIQQKFDFSCGSAALATLLKYHYKYDITEQDVLARMYEHGEKEKIRKEGFSLLDMKNYLAAKGLKAGGFKASLDKLKQARIPAIVLINNAGYLHFVVVRGVRNNMVLLADPALGMRIVSRKDFEKMWNNILFVITDSMSVAQATFDSDEDWRIKQKATFDAALSNEALGSFTVYTAPTPNYFF